MITLSVIMVSGFSQVIKRNHNYQGFSVAQKDIDSSRVFRLFENVVWPDLERWKQNEPFCSLSKSKITKKGS